MTSGMCLRYQWTLLLVALTCATLGSVSSSIECSNNIFEERGVIFPKLAILSDGDNLTLTCVYQHPIDYNVSSDMFFVLLGEEQQHKVINDTTIQLTKHNVTHGDGNAGVYTCFAKCQGDFNRDTVGNRKVEIYVNPEPPEKLRCVSNNYNDVNCSWCPSDGAIPDGVSWTATWSLVNDSNNAQDQDCHMHYGPCNCYICGNYNGTVSECKKLGVEKRFRRYKEVEIQLVTKVYRTGKNVTKTFKFDPKYITKPSPVESFETGVIRSRSIEIRWKPTLFLSHDTIAMNYSVSYASKWTADIKSVMFGPYSKQRTTVSEHLTNLTAYTNYTVTIRPVPCEHREGDFFGDPRHLFIQTAEDAPECAPIAFRGSFRSESCINRRNDGFCRNIIFYWRNIKERFWNGIVTNCTLELSGISAPSRVDCPHVHKHKLTLSTDGVHTAQMAMYTAAGPSPPAVWHLVNLDEAEELFPRDISVEVVPGHDEKLLKFEWSRPAWQEPISNYTIFYGKKDLTDDFQNLTAVYLGPENTNYLLKLEGASRAYNLAMSTQTVGRSSGMTPPLCVYMYNKEPRKINLKLAPVQSERSLKLKWEKLVCQSSYQYGKPGKIQISWQRSESQALMDANGRGEMADSRVIEKSVSLPPTATEYIILDLLPYTSYDVTAKVISTGNRVSKIDVLQNVTTLESKPEDSPTIVNITGITSTSFTVHWGPPSKPNGQIVEYILNYTNTETQISKEIPQGTSRKATVPNLKGLTKYTVMVKARNGGNLESNYSDPKTVTTKATAPPSWAVAVAVLGGLLLGILLIFLTWCCWNRWKSWIYDIKPVDLKPIEITREAEDIKELVDKQEVGKATERRSDGSFSDVVINPKRSPQKQISKSSTDSGVFENDKETTETQGSPGCSDVAEDRTYFTSSRVNPMFSGDSDGSGVMKDTIKPDGPVHSAGHQEGRPVSSDVSEYDNTNEAYLKVVNKDDYVPTAIQIQEPGFLDSSGVSPETIQIPSQDLSSYSRINGYVKHFVNARKDTNDETDENLQNLAPNFPDAQFLKTWPPNGYVPKDINFENFPNGMILQDTKCSLPDDSDLTSGSSGTTTSDLVWSNGDSDGSSSAVDNYVTTLLRFDEK